MKEKSFKETKPGTEIRQGVSVQVPGDLCCRDQTQESERTWKERGLR